MPLECLSPNLLWHATQPLKFGPVMLSTRMTVVRFPDGALWVHSPILPTGELIRELEAIGSVRWVVAPNRSHHLFFLPFLAAHPAAEGFIAPGLEAKRPDLKGYPCVSTAAAWRNELEAFFIDGLPVLNETVWFHRETGSLILTDLLFCISPGHRGLAKGIARLLGIYDSLGMSRTMKMLVKDKSALRHSVAPLLDLPVRRIIVAHDEIIEDACNERLSRAFSWLVRA